MKMLKKLKQLSLFKKVEKDYPVNQIYPHTKTRQLNVILKKPNKL